MRKLLSPHFRRVGGAGGGGCCYQASFTTTDSSTIYVPPERHVVTLITLLSLQVYTPMTPLFLHLVPSWFLRCRTRTFHQHFKAVNKYTQQKKRLRLVKTDCLKAEKNEYLLIILQRRPLLLILKTKCVCLVFIFLGGGRTMKCSYEPNGGLVWEPLMWDNINITH